MVKEAEKVETLESRELDNYEKEAKAFLAGGGLGDDFRPFRLQQGVYGQRQDDAQMIRIKVPHGTMTAEQLDMVATVANDYTPRHDASGNPTPLRAAGEHANRAPQAR